MITSYNLYGPSIHDVLESIPRPEFSGIGRFMKEHVTDSIYNQPIYIPATSGCLGLRLPNGQKRFREPRVPDQAMIWDLPAHGESKERCGAVKDAIVCPTGHYAKLELYHCDSPNCPECAPWTIEQRARMLSEQLVAVLENERPKYGVQHWIISPPQEDAIRLMSSVKGWENMKASIKAVLKAVGFKEAVVVFHPWRENDDEPGTWRLGPHFHVFAFGFLDWKSDYVKTLQKDGWVIVVKPKKDMNDGHDYSKGRYWSPVDIYHGVAYALSHAGVCHPEGREKRSPSFLKISEHQRVVDATEEQLQHCSVCESNGGVAILDDECDCGGHGRCVHSVVHNLHSLIRLRDVHSIFPSEIRRKKKIGIFVRKDHRDKFLEMVRKSYIKPDDLLPILMEFHKMGVLASLLPFTEEGLEGVYIKVAGVSKQGLTVRGDVCTRLWRAIESCKGWTAEEYDSFEDEWIVNDCTLARVGG